MTIPYVTEFQWSDPDVALDFIKTMRAIVRQEIKDLKFDRHYPVEIVSVGSGVASIKLLGGDKVIPNVKVRPGLTVTPGQKAYVLAINDSLNNMFIDISW